MAAVFIKNPLIEGELAKSTTMRKVMRSQADAIVETAKSIAPTGGDGDYAEKIISEETATGAKVAATDFESGWIEFGTRYWAGHGTIRKACEMLGFKVLGGKR